MTHGLCDTLDVVTKDLAVTLGATPIINDHRRQRKLAVSKPVHSARSQLRLTFQDPFRLFHGQT